MRTTTPLSSTSGQREVALFQFPLPRTRSDLFLFSSSSSSPPSSSPSSSSFSSQKQQPSSLPTSIHPQNSVASSVSSCCSSPLNYCHCCSSDQLAEETLASSSSVLTKSNNDHSITSLVSRFASPSSCTPISTSLRTSKETTSTTTTTTSSSSSSPSPSPPLSTSSSATKSIPLPVRTLSAEFNHSFENSLSFGSTFLPSSSSTSSRRRQRETTKHENENENEQRIEGFSIPSLVAATTTTSAPSSSSFSTSSFVKEQEETHSEEPQEANSEMAGMLWRRMCQALGQTSVIKAPSVAFPSSAYSSGAAAASGVHTSSPGAATISTLASPSNATSPSPSPSPSLASDHHHHHHHHYYSSASEKTGGGGQGTTGTGTTGAKRRKGPEPVRLPTVEPLSSVLGLHLASTLPSSESDRKPFPRAQQVQPVLSPSSSAIAIPQQQTSHYQQQQQITTTPCLRTSTSSLWLESSPPSNLFLFDEEMAKCETPKKSQALPQSQPLPMLYPQPQTVSLRLVGGTSSSGVLPGVGSRHSLSRSLSRSQFDDEDLLDSLEGMGRKRDEGEEEKMFEDDLENVSPNAVVTILEPLPAVPADCTSALPSSTSSVVPSSSLSSSFTTVKVLETTELKGEERTETTITTSEEASSTSSARTPSPSPSPSGSIKISSRSFMYEMSSSSSSSSRWRFEVSWKDVWMVAVEVSEPHPYWLIFYHASSSGKAKEGALRIPIDEEQVTGSSEDLLEAMEAWLVNFQLENYLQVMDCSEDVGHIITVWKEQRQRFFDR